jgi:formylglycine-generating enzyme required for sulfatase activity
MARTKGLIFRVLFIYGTVITTLRAGAVVIIWSAVGDLGNAPDSKVMSTDGTTGYGSIGYSYQIGTYDVTNAQYAEFLNWKDPSGTNALGLYKSGMASDPHIAGISYSQTAPSGNKYSVIPGQGSKPVTYVNWFDTLRFANWLNNGQGNSDTETGAYTLLGGTPIPTNADAITRDPAANVFLPNENEWYKAAYYRAGGKNAGYWSFATQSNLAASAAPSPTAVNSANYWGGPSLGYAVTGSPTTNSAQNYLTDVGAYGASSSAYGTFDQSGDVYQWTESTITTSIGPGRVLRGGSWGNEYYSLESSYRVNSGVASEGDNDIGFRIASIPEPVGALTLMSGAIALNCRKRRAK